MISSSLRVPLRPANAAFFVQWQSLRQGRQLPHVSDWTTALPPQLAGRLIRVEFVDEVPIVRYVGPIIAARWRTMMVGRPLMAHRSPKFRDPALANLITAIGHPCGLCVEMIYATAGAEVSRMQWLMLPLTSSSGRPSVVSMLDDVTPFPAGDTATFTSRMADAWWIDIGAGVPNNRTFLPEAA